MASEDHDAGTGQYGTKVLETDLYEWEFSHDTATCVDCKQEMEIDEYRDGMEEPHWRREEHYWPAQDLFEALCDSCYAQSVSEILEGSGR